MLKNSQGTDLTEDQPSNRRTFRALPAVPMSVIVFLRMRQLTFSAIVGTACILNPDP